MRPAGLEVAQLHLADGQLVEGVGARATERDRLVESGPALRVPAEPAAAPADQEPGVPRGRGATRGAAGPARRPPPPDPCGCRRRRAGTGRRPGPGRRSPSGSAGLPHAFAGRRRGARTRRGVRGPSRTFAGAGGRRRGCSARRARPDRRRAHACTPRRPPRAPHRPGHRGRALEGPGAAVVGEREVHHGDRVAGEQALERPEDLDREVVVAVAGRHDARAGELGFDVGLDGEDESAVVVRVLVRGFAGEKLQGARDDRLPGELLRRSRRPAV